MRTILYRNHKSNANTIIFNILSLFLIINIKANPKSKLTNLLKFNKANNKYFIPIFPI